ncbi:hypothetical protein ACLESO_18825 [Pyxidicoccus sp. 3LG]
MSNVTQTQVAEGRKSVCVQNHYDLTHRHGLEYVPAEPAEAVTTIEELEARLMAAYEDPKPYSLRRAARQAEADALDPAAAAQRDKDWDW